MLMMMMMGFGYHQYHNRVAIMLGQPASQREREERGTVAMLRERHMNGSTIECDDKRARPGTKRLCVCVIFLTFCEKDTLSLSPPDRHGIALFAMIMVPVTEI